VKEVLRGRRFSSNEEVTVVVQNWLKTRPKNFFSDGIKKTYETQLLLVERLYLGYQGLFPWE
jgi:hypothetical protein